MSIIVFAFACLSCVGHAGARRLALHDSENDASEKILEDIVTELEKQMEGEKRKMKFHTPEKVQKSEFEQQIEFSKDLVKAAEAGMLLGANFVTELEKQLHIAEHRAQLQKTSKLASEVDSGSEFHPQSSLQFNRAFVAAAKAGLLLGEDFVTELEAEVEAEVEAARHGDVSEFEFHPKYEFNKALMKAAKEGQLLGANFVTELETQVEAEYNHAHFKAQGAAESKKNLDSELDHDHRGSHQFNKAFVTAAKAGQMLGANFVTEFEERLEAIEHRAKLETQEEASESELDSTLEFNKAFMKAAKAGQFFGGNFVAELEADLEGDEHGHATPEAESVSELADFVEFNEAFVKAAKAALEAEIED